MEKRRMEEIALLVTKARQRRNLQLVFQAARYKANTLGWDNHRLRADLLEVQQQEMDLNHGVAAMLSDAAARYEVTISDLREFQQVVFAELVGGFNFEEVFYLISRVVDTRRVKG